MIFFVWEFIFGMLKYDFENVYGCEFCVFFEEFDEVVNSKDYDGLLSSSSLDGLEESLFWEFFNMEFEFSSWFGGMVELVFLCVVFFMFIVEEFFFNG